MGPQEHARNETEHPEKDAEKKDLAQLEFIIGGEGRS